LHLVNARYAAKGELDEANGNFFAQLLFRGYAADPSVCGRSVCNRDRNALSLNDQGRGPLVFRKICRGSLIAGLGAPHSLPAVYRFWPILEP
jgi:hypothetical protein